MPAISPLLTSLCRSSSPSAVPSPSAEFIPSSSALGLSTQVTPLRGPLSRRALPPRVWAAWKEPDFSCPASVSTGCVHSLDGLELQELGGAWSVGARGRAAGRYSVCVSKPFVLDERSVTSCLSFWIQQKRLCKHTLTPVLIALAGQDEACASCQDGAS